jgi:PAS domain-containing protein
MSLLVKEIIKNFLPEEENKRTVALYAGGFKPPTQGHFEVVETALKQNPEIDEFIIFIGHKERDGITQDESLLIWEIYNNYLPFKVKLEPTSLPPIRAIYDYSKNHPTQEVLWVIGAREGNEEDFKDINSRTRSITNYPNIEVRTIITKGGVSGTAARNASKVSFEKFEPFLPKQLTPEEKQEVYQIVSSNIKEQLNENASYSQHIDTKQKIKELTQHMLQKGMNIIPLPKVIFKHSDIENAKQFLGKTAYYNPETMEIVLYTEGRHPKDIVKSFSHELVHHIQNLENRLGNITTANTLEDDHLNKLEQEANLVGTMTFRNWTDSLQETLFEQEDQLMGEVVNPDGERFEYKESNVKGLFTYKDSYNNLYFVRILYNPLSTNSYFEFKTGWFKDNDLSKPTYDPHLPSNTTGMDNLKRRNTVAKIYRDEILPFFIANKSLSNKLYIKPISHSRHIFSKRLVKNHTSKDFNIEEDGETIIISLPQNESKNKDPFGLNAYAMELARLREEETQYTIYCDMDGVLVDFDRGYQELTGITAKHADAQGVDKFWEPLTKAGAAFWIKLKWMSDGKQLWDYIKKYNPELLSAPSREESSKLGKRVWVKRELPGVKLILKYASQKQEYASPTSILIDDREKNIKQWEAAGGIGIFHTSAADTIKQLKQLGL